MRARQGACLGAFSGAAGCKAGGRLTASPGNFRVSPSSPKSREVGGLSRPRRRLRPAAPRSAPGTPCPIQDPLEDSEGKRGSERAQQGGEAPAEEGGYRPHRASPDRPRLGTAVLVSRAHTLICPSWSWE